MIGESSPEVPGSSRPPENEGTPDDRTHALKVPPDRLPARPGESPQGKPRVEMRYVGPLPPPSMLRQFDDMVPGLASRIVDEAFTQAAHRRELEKHMLHAATDSRKQGMWIGAALGVIALLSALAAAAMGQSWVAGAFITAVTGGLVTSFFGSYARQKSEIEAKATDQKNMTPRAEGEPNATNP